MNIAIGAAAGNVGSRVARRVADGGATPVLIGHHAEKLVNLNIANAVTKVADMSNASQMIQATEGADALFWLVPPVSAAPNLADWYRRITAAAVAAVTHNQIKRVVLISSLGAGSADNLGTVSYVGQTEVAFDTLDAQVLALRPGYFMENLLMQARQIGETGQFSFPYDADHDIPFISTDDIGDAAADYLLSETWAGHWKLNLMGPENISPRTLANRLSALLNRTIQYRQQSWDEVNEQLSHWGVMPTIQQELVDLFRALGDPDGVYATPRTPEAYTPTSLEEFAGKKLIPLLTSAGGTP